MTIIAGFKCLDGIVICSDTQETVAHSKRQVSKLRFEPFLRFTQTEGPSAAFCGSGDKLIEEAWQAARTASSLNEACSEIESVIKKIYSEFGAIYQNGFCPSVDLIYGVKMSDRSRLFAAHGPLVNEKHEYDSAGAGYYMADFLAARMYTSSLNLHQGVNLAAYILLQAKEHVDGCGGESHIAVLRDNGTSGRVDMTRVNAITDLLKTADVQAGTLLLNVADFSINAENFSESIKTFDMIFSKLREKTINEIRTQDENRRMFSFLAPKSQNDEERDFFGLPVAPD